MTEKECGQLVITASAYHPNTFKDNYQLEQTIKAWYYVLQDIDFKAAMNALVALEASGTLTYFPTVGMIRNAVIPITQGESYLTEGEALTMYRKAMADGNYHAADWWEKFPPEMRRAVGSPNNLTWDNNYMGEYNAGVQEAQFLARYRKSVQELQGEARMPQGIKSLTEQKKAEIEAQRTPEIAEKIIPIESERHGMSDSAQQMIAEFMKRRCRA